MIRRFLFIILFLINLNFGFSISLDSNGVTIHCSSETPGTTAIYNSTTYYIASDMADIQNNINGSIDGSTFTGSYPANHICTSHVNSMDPSGADNTGIFYNQPNFNQDISSWDTSHVTNMRSMFRDASSFNQNLSFWNVSSVTMMGSMFNSALSFNGNISNWDVSSVTYMRFMFEASNFNQDISNWDVSNVGNMYGTFMSASSFNQDISNWNVNSVTDMTDLFWDANSFNSDLSSWNVSKVTSMTNMFLGATNFNSDLSNWDVSKVTHMTNMFSSATSFNQPLNNWNVSNVIKMNNMFNYASNFNQPLNSWDVGNVNDMQYMFRSASNFNQPLNNWDVSNVTNMDHMFYSTSSFDQDLSSWDVSNVTTMNSMFDSSGLSVENYSNILVGWSSLPSLQNNVLLGASGINYWNSSADERQNLIDTWNWTINDGSVVFPTIIVNYLSSPSGDQSDENVFIQVNATESIDSCTLHWNNENYSMAVSGKKCSKTQIGIFGNSYSYNVTVIGTNSAINYTNTVNVNLIDTSIHYVNPTPINNLQKFNLTQFTIKFSNGNLSINDCIFNIDGTNHSNNPIGNYCSYNYTLSNQSGIQSLNFQGFYNISGNITALNKRKLTSYFELKDNSNSVPSFSFASIIFAIIIIVGGLI